jgi:hypothetical protein
MTPRDLNLATCVNCFYTTHVTTECPLLTRHGQHPTQAQIQQRYEELPALLQEQNGADHRLQQTFVRGRRRGRGNSRGRRQSQYNQPHIDYYFRRVHFASKVEIINDIIPLEVNRIEIVQPVDRIQITSSQQETPTVPGTLVFRDKGSATPVSCLHWQHLYNYSLQYFNKTIQ